MKLNEKGAVPVLILVAVIGLVAFILISSTASFRDSLFAMLYPKGKSFASEPISTPTPMESSTPVPVVDSDSDGWSDDKEIFLTTNRFEACPKNTQDNAWPPDLNNDRVVNSKDLDALNKVIVFDNGRKGALIYTPRDDLNMDGKINSLDASVLNTYMGQSCTVISTPRPKGK